MRIIFLIAVAVFSLFYAPKMATAQSSPLPNIIVFLVDDLGWADLNCYGSDLHETPNIDKLARMGVRFTHAYSASTVCSPSRAAIMTGKYPARLNITDWISGSINKYGKVQVPDWQKFLPLEEETLAEYLKDKGYSTGHIGKWHLGEDTIYYPQHQGFDVNIAGYSKGSPPSYFYPYERQNRNPIPYLEGGEEGEYLTDRLTKEALHFIKKQASKPFFLNFDHYSVHTPIQAKEEQRQYYESKIQEGMTHQNAKYAAMVHSTDESMGRIMELLDSLEIMSNTMIIFTSDNGGLILRNITSNAPLRSGKGSPYEGGTRVPMIIKPAHESSLGFESEEPVISMDIFATIRDLLEEGSQVVYEDGYSLLPLLEAEGNSLKREALYWHYPHHHQGGSAPHSAIRMGNYKLIEFYEKDEHELYHLVEDIGESQNLVHQQSEISKDLYQQLKKWKVEVGAQLPTPNPHYDSLKALKYYHNW